MARIFAIGDLHGNVNNELSFINTKNFPEQKELTKKDVLIQKGDFGFIWYYPEVENKYKTDLNYLNEIAKRRFSTLIVPGNHENYDIINSLPVETKWEGNVYVYNTKYGPIYFAKRGEIYNIDGKKIFTFSGARSNKESNRFSIDDFKSNEKKAKIKYKNYIQKQVFEKVKISEVNFWPQELPIEKEYEYARENLYKHNYKVDLVVTHTAPVEAIKEIIHKTDYTIERFDDPVALFLSDIFNIIEFKQWEFAHFHTNCSIVLDNKYSFRCDYKIKPKEILI